MPVLMAKNWKLMEGKTHSLVCSVTPPSLWTEISGTGLCTQKQ